MRRGVLFVLLGLTVAGAGVLSTRAGFARESASEPLQAGRRLVRVPPARAVDEALRTGDCRMLALAGLGPVVPVVDDLPQPVRSSLEPYGLHFIPGAGHVVTSWEEQRFRKHAYRYAKRYNRILVGRLTGPGGRLADGGACRRAES